MERIYDMIKQRFIELNKPEKDAMRIISFAKDIIDDGKRNFSNEVSKKSPGRKKKVSKKK